MRNGFMTEPGSKRSLTVRSRRPSASLWHAREREDLSRAGIDDDERAALRLVGVHRRLDLALGDVLDPLVDGQDDVVSLQRLPLVAAALEDEAAAPVAQAMDLLDLAAQVLVERELEPVLALRVGGHEPEERAGELAPRIVAMALALDRQTVDGVWLLLGIAEVAHGLRLVAVDAALDPREAMARRELGVEVGRVERERLADARRRVAQSGFLRRVAVDAAEQLHRVDADARDLDADRERCPVAVEDGAPLRLDVQAALALLLGHVPPLGAVLDLDAPGARDDAAEGDAHDAAQDPHAGADPSGAAGVEVSHGGPSRGGAPFIPTTGAGSAEADETGGTAAMGSAGMATIRSGGGGSMPSSERATISTRSGVL
jgi:hypothetical protein